MKKQTLKLENTRDLTQVVSKLNTQYVVNVRPAQGGNGDDVYWLMNKTTGFHLEFCTKVRKSDGKLFVNWARVTGPEDVVDRFLKAVGYYTYDASPTANVILKF